MKNEQYSKSDISPIFPDISLVNPIPDAIERSWQVGSLQAIEELEAIFSNNYQSE